MTPHAKLHRPPLGLRVSSTLPVAYPPNSSLSLLMFFLPKFYCNLKVEKSKCYQNCWFKIYPEGILAEGQWNWLQSLQGFIHWFFFKVLLLRASHIIEVSHSEYAYHHKKPEDGLNAWCSMLLFLILVKHAAVGFGKPWDCPLSIQI